MAGRRDGGRVATEAKSELRQPKSRNANDHQELEEANDRFSPSPEGVWLCRHLDFRFLAFRTVRE